MTADGPNELWAEIAQWAIRRGAGDISKLPGCWEAEAEFNGMPMTVAFNGHNTDCKNSLGGTIPQFHAVITINGWPAVMVGPGGGTILSGEPDSEDRLIETFKALS